MSTRNILLVSLLAALYGCQNDDGARPAEWRLAKETGCFMCHTTNKNLLGPAWDNVAERYRNNPDAEAHLMNKILNGGSGAWISKDMPGYPEKLLGTSNRKALVKYILSLEKAV